jgi:hypothetical protein
VDLTVTSLEFGLRVNVDISMTDLPNHVDRNERHAIQVVAKIASGSSFSIAGFLLNVDALFQSFGTEYHLEDYIEYGLPILTRILAVAGVSLPAAGTLEVARQILTYTDIILYLDFSSQVSVSGPCRVDRNNMNFRTSDTQGFTVTIDGNAQHKQLVKVSNMFLLESKFKFDLDKQKVPDWVYGPLNSLLHLPWEVSLGSSYGDQPLETTAIVFDKTPPVITIISPEHEVQFFSRSIKVEWSGSDDYGIDHYEIRLDEGAWMNLGMQTEFMLSNIGGGWHTVEVKAVDVAGNTKVDSVRFALRPKPGPIPEFSDKLLRVPLVGDAVLFLDNFLPGYGAILFLALLTILLALIIFVLTKHFFFD